MGKLLKATGYAIAGFIVVTGWALALPEYFPYETLIKLFYYFM